LKVAEHAVREHTVTASRWHDLRSALDAASAAYGAIESDIQTKTAEDRKLTRIRRVCRHVRARAELNAAIEALGHVITLPENAFQVLESALNDDNQATARLSTVTEQIVSLAAEHAALAYDEALLARADDINRLHERRIQVHAGMADLPKRRAELTAAESHLKRLAAELEWVRDVADEIIANIPARAKLAHARALSNRRGELLSAASNARAALDEAEDRERTLRREIDAEGSLTDVSALAATIGVVRESGDLTARAAALEAEVRDSERMIEELLATMHPRASDTAELASMVVPAKATLESQRDAVRALEQKVQGCRDRIQNVERDLLRQTRAYERIAREEQAVPSEEVQPLREHRERGWSLIRRKYIDGSSVPDEEIRAFGSDQTLSDAYQAAVVSADAAADRRFEKAEIVAQLAVSVRQIDETRELLETLREEERTLAEQLHALENARQQLWSGSGLNPLGGDIMLEWIELRSQILQIASRRTATQRDAAMARREEANARDLLVRDLKSIGVDTTPIAARPLRAIVEIAQEIQRRHENRAATRNDLEAGFKKSTAETGRKRKALEAAEVEMKAWQDRWTAAIQSLRLNAAAPSETLDAQINAIDELRELANRINDLRHERIDKIERDIAAFETEVSQMVCAVAPELADQASQDAVLELERRLALAKTAHDLAASADRKLSDARQKAEQCSGMQREARQNIERLQCAASVGSVDGLRAAIGRSDRLSSLRRDLDSANKALAEDGDGMAVDVLVGECAEVDLDDVAAREQRVGGELKGLRERLMKAQEVRADARREFEAIGGSDLAARAAADRQAALSEMTDIAEDYVSVRSAVLLLQWAVERYRREKQAPLLKRAGALFSVLTGGSFTELQLEFDEHDKMHLAGVRGNGKTVPVSGLSTGTADQLYLALRVAAVEDFLNHGAALPFIADDLFINFDDDRAAAGFKILGELARKTQVLFFTHHQHLLNVANEAIGTKVPTNVLVPQIPGPVAGTRDHSREAA
jgi:uncharacterized protein YhaN